MSLFDLSNAVSAFSSGSYLVERKPIGAYVDGVYVRGDTQTFSVSASVQPLSSRELMILPEGLRTSDSRNVFTDVELRTKTQDGEPDRITIDNEIYQIHKVEQWNKLGNFFKCLAVKDTVS